ncbi:hypothetical protein FIBSPDRAFT_855096 [Athelia psychrophila]|uniref:Uncharacterized protein n=1 Tax=Athelia psychrophila TaxID=1759441 RepID=A0A166PIZ8_9AGAM|nr:hypothetical protein FIBSPDRAFT_855096 [Fibularhizoctonia sp. CBS 109695]
MGDEKDENQGRKMMSCREYNTSKLSGAYSYFPWTELRLVASESSDDPPPSSSLIPPFSA